MIRNCSYVVTLVVAGQLSKTNYENILLLIMVTHLSYGITLCFQTMLIIEISQFEHQDTNHNTNVCELTRNFWIGIQPVSGESIQFTVSG